MHEAFDEYELETVPQRRDTELTLGPLKLLGLCFALVLLCGLFFGMGYSMGHRSSPASSVDSAQPTAAAQTALPADASRLKPSATAQTATAPPQDEAGPSSTDSSSAVEDTDPVTSVQVPVPAAGSFASQPVVRPALSPQPAPQPGGSLTTGGIKAQPVPVSALMVQIAAVSHSEDAEVLVGALRKHGYAVAVSRDAVDGLLHVRIGPFFNRSEAGTMREKLLNDGYNAIVQP
jgi:cell division septation protein DedD